jgi:hypothetical protein
MEHLKTLLELNGTLSKNGSEIATTGDELKLDGNFVLSGCSEEALVKAIGLEAITQVYSPEELLDMALTREVLIGYLTHSKFNDEDIKYIADSLNNSLVLDESITLE